MSSNRPLTSSPIPQSHGVVIEARTREIAALLGVADFVFTVPVLPKSQAWREVGGDGLLIVGDHGAIIQVKAREPGSAAKDDVARVAQWVEKQIAKAVSQGDGCRRELGHRMAGGIPVVAMPIRAASLSETDKAAYMQPITTSVIDWPTIIVIDHPRANGTTYSVPGQVFVISLDDWHALHRRLRSTQGLLRYVSRVLAGRVTVPLGYERDRYVALYEADRTVVEAASYILYDNATASARRHGRPGQ